MSEGSGRFVPFSVRDSGGSAVWDVLHEQVPQHLVASLRSLVLNTVNDQKLPGVVERRLRLRLSPRVHESQLQVLARWADEAPARYLDLADCVLFEMGAAYQASQQAGGSVWGDPREDAAADYVKALVRMLHDGDSAYEVSAELEGPWRLVHRVDATATAAVQDAASRGKGSSELLASAWAATFQRTPDLSVAYRDVVLAVEVAACPVLIPKDPTPTLGKAISHLRQTLVRWTVASLDDQDQASSATLLGMLQTVWQNHQRHAGQGGRAPDQVEQGEAEAVLFLAVTLVQWFERGLVVART